MSKRLCFLIYPVFVLILSSVSFGAPGSIRLDFNERDDVVTQPGFTSFLLTDSGKTINGITIYLAGNIDDRRRNYPYDPEYPIPYGDLYRDFIYGIQPSGVTITLFGLGANQSCKINLYAYDAEIEPTRATDWYSNGTFMFTADFNGGLINWPDDITDYNNTATVTADAYGRIILTSTRNPVSPSGQVFAVVNALLVTPQGTYIQPDYATNPKPADGEEKVPINVVLSWTGGGHSTVRDVYFGTDEAKVTDANRSNPLGVLVSENHSTTTYTPPGLLDLNTPYFWRIDEVNDPAIWTGEVCNFKTSPYFVVDNFDSYGNDSALRSVWKDYTTNGTGAEVSVETAIIRSGKSMKYRYKNNLSPYYSQAYADIDDLGIDDPDWLGTGAEDLILYFHVEPNNPFTEQMYVKLTDGDSPANTATVMYTDTNNVRLKQWNRWSIPFTEFTDVNLSNVARITIGFGDTAPGVAGTVYFEDILIGEEVISPQITGDAHIGIVYQELEGFGAAGGWQENYVTGMTQTTRNNFYNAVFSELGLDIYRLRNTYNQGGSYMTNSAQIVAAGKARNPSLKILISAWSPPIALKSNNALAHGTLKKDAYGNYMYNEYAQWWYDSLVAWTGLSVVADYVGMQNEPDYDATWDSCRFDPTENSSVAGFNQACEAVYQKLNSQMGPNMPKILAPETAGFNGITNYINNLIDSNHVYGYAHHLYNGGGTYDNPDGYINSMTTFYNNNKDSYGNKPLMQTEFSKGGDGDVTSFTEAMNLARLMHNSLVFESASAYIYWELFWTNPKGLVSFPSYGTYRINPIYYAFKHYAAFTNPGWHRVEASTDLGSLGDLRISAFKNPGNDQMTVVILNKSAASTEFSLTLKGFTPTSSEVYRTSPTASWVSLGPYSPSLTLPANSFTTIHTTGIASPVPTNCSEVHTAGFGLTSDIDNDCRVNFKDFAVIADHWLSSDCTGPDNCGGADFEPTNGSVDFSDLGTFVLQWLVCNNPGETDCIENWL